MFLIAIAELVCMFSFRWWQIRSGKVEYDTEANHHIGFDTREMIAKYVAIIALYAGKVHQTHIVPLVHSITQIVVRHLTEQFGAAHKKLLRVKRSLEGRSEIIARGEASPFLKTIAEYKLNGNAKKENPRAGDDNNP